MEFYHEKLLSEIFGLVTWFLFWDKAHLPSLLTSIVGCEVPIPSNSGVELYEGANAFIVKAASWGVWP